ncbi:DMT family transporter [Streptomyces profundus]|uniref:DMT family transporter n=1 Tax=Streptomyces profundus TaxID=2867410 RepID=UPI001D165ACD|nr:DMT family transporter [Streptomyces sp. MA3_2.13]UED88808.1 DMT family transporter [Streptomyces sp. MA3_2.13]
MRAIAAEAPAGRHTLDGLLLATAIVGISLSGPLIATVAAPALAIALWRNALAVASLTPALLRRSVRRELGRLSRRTVLLSIAAGGALAAHFALWLPSLRLTSVASSVALVTTTPIWTTVLLRLLGHRPPRLVWWGTLLSFSGVLLLTGVDLAISGRALAGDALALGGGLAGAVYVLIGAEVRRTTSTTSYTLLCYTAAAVPLLGAALATGAELTGYSAETWGKLLLLTVASQLLGHSLLNRVVRGLGPSITSTAILLETPGAAVIAAVWLGQLPPPAAYPALAVILLGLVLVIRAERAGTAPPAPPAPSREPPRAHTTPRAPA